MSGTSFILAACCLLLLPDTLIAHHLFPLCNTNTVQNDILTATLNWKNGRNWYIIITKETEALINLQQFNGMIQINSCSQIGLEHQ